MLYFDSENSIVTYDVTDIDLYKSKLTQEQLEQYKYKLSYQLLVFTVHAFDFLISLRIFHHNISDNNQMKTSVSTKLHFCNCNENSLDT